MERLHWTRVWGSRYPILKRYRNEVYIPMYEEKINAMLDELKSDYSYSELDAMLVLKDILYTSWKKGRK